MDALKRAVFGGRYAVTGLTATEKKTDNSEKRVSAVVGNQMNPFPSVFGVSFRKGPFENKKSVSEEEKLQMLRSSEEDQCYAYPALPAYEPSQPVITEETRLKRMNEKLFSLENKINCFLNSTDPVQANNEIQSDISIIRGLIDCLSVSVEKNMFLDKFNGVVKLVLTEEKFIELIQKKTEDCLSELQVLERKMGICEYRNAEENKSEIQPVKEKLLILEKFIGEVSLELKKMESVFCSADLFDLEDLISSTSNQCKVLSEKVAHIPVSEDSWLASFWKSS